MPPRSPDVLAHRLLAGAGAAPASDASGGLPNPVSAAALVFDAMAETLAGWFGPYGYNALLTRALARARVAHPALAGVRVRTPLTPVLDGLSEAAAEHGAPAVTAAVAAVIAGLVDLLGRVIGADMALQLMDPVMNRLTPRPPDPSSDRSGMQRVASPTATMRDRDDGGTP